MDTLLEKVKANLILGIRRMMRFAGYITAAAVSMRKATGTSGRDLC